MKRVVIIGGGFGGLAAAAELARSGHEVTLLEAHIYAGGCAGTFFYQGYRFDAGATLAGGFAPGAPMDSIGQRFGIQWGEKFEERAMEVHLPDGTRVTRWTENERWLEERLKNFGPEAEPFWNWQESTADFLWDLAMQLPEWPPTSSTEVMSLVRTGLVVVSENSEKFLFLNHLKKFPDLFKSVDTHLKNASPQLRAYLDGQLLISAQTTSKRANALYGAAALDLSRRGIVSVPGGLGGMAEKLVETIRKFGGEVHFRKVVTSVQKERSDGFVIKTRRKEEFFADTVIFNLTPWNIASLLSTDLRSGIRLPDNLPEDIWGAFVLYLGVDSGLIPDGIGLHYQILKGGSLGEGKSLFLSISPEWDATRAPPGKRAITISTHTKPEQWWDLIKKDEKAYERRKEELTAEILKTANQLIPGIGSRCELILSGTPVTFQNFTRREAGWVGGFPQTSLFRMRRPRLARNIWMVGDSIFPGQSVPAVVLGGLRVAQSVIGETARNESRSFPSFSLPLNYREC